MSAKVFLDTNVLVYANSDSDIEKRNVTRKLISDNTSVISTQVLQELANVLTKKAKLSYQDSIKVIEQSCNNNILVINSRLTILSAHNIAEQHRYSFYDSLIISAAMEGCSILYTEDLHHGHIVNNLKIINPFRLSEKMV